MTFLETFLSKNFTKEYTGMTVKGNPEVLLRSFMNLTKSHVTKESKNK